MTSFLQVYDCDLAATPNLTATAMEFLSPEEAERAQRFYFEKDRMEFVGCKALQRILIGRKLGLAPGSLVFTVNAFGKPALAKDLLFFNISHSHGRGLIGLGNSGELGVDVEYIERRLEIAELAERFFSKQECEELFGLPLEQQKQGFFNAWSRKEAYIKARGKGISYGLESFSVQLTPGAPARLLEDQNDLEAPMKWKIEDLPVKPGFVAAAAFSPGQNLELLRISAEDFTSLITQELRAHKKI
ncbi:MAG: 4-phosphopantetheinyl transferase [Verrucomicrobiales bacterium]|nr:4-phosphopantetheinyl transferase [Verrucomicrobiales bacterium]